MTESQFQSKLRRALQARMPRATIWKITDRFTSGIPDMIITVGALTTSLELKVRPRGVTTLQWETLKRLDRGYVVKWGYGHTWEVVHAQDVKIQFGARFEDLVEYLVALCQK